MGFETKLAGTINLDGLWLNVMKRWQEANKTRQIKRVTNDQNEAQDEVLSSNNRHYFYYINDIQSRYGVPIVACKNEKRKKTS